MHLNITQGHFIFFDWKKDSWKEFQRKEHELRMQGFRKVNHEFEFQDFFVTYKRKKRRVVLTMALC